MKIFNFTFFDRGENFIDSVISKVHPNSFTERIKFAFGDTSALVSLKKLIYFKNKINKYKYFL
jgi:hypothetical protein